MYTIDRLILRKRCVTDIDNFLRIWNDGRCRPTISTTYNAPLSKEAIGSSFIFSGPKTIFAVAVTLKEDGAFVGWCSIRSSNQNRDGTLGIALLPEYWNKGYGTETTRFVIDHCFKKLRLHRVTLEVCEGNGGAIKVYERVGFVVEGRRLKCNWVNGKWRDIISMAILDEEYWEAHPRLAGKIWGALKRDRRQDGSRILRKRRVSLPYFLFRSSRTRTTLATQ